MVDVPVTRTRISTGTHRIRQEGRLNAAARSLWTEEQTSTMRRLLKIEKIENGLLAVHFKDFSRFLPSKALYWSILFVDGVSTPGQGMTMEKLEELVNKSPRGLVISWERLISIIDDLYDIHHLEIVAEWSLDKIRKYGSRVEMYEESYISIELFDSAYWLISSKDESIIDEIVRELPDISEIKEY